ncbi:CPBP family intramembrane glutamic endopeptidase [Desulfoluna sp.]|uniref:CPBP family intramembrane glutamic endopeptidase n=1 Tax=Desulfoluna sp. TaxID=2045199 RepID=UPI002636C815|nr:CPBP family intramembrane glutamic endopeptidase [Desulfoluna sp.]
MNIAMYSHPIRFYFLSTMIPWVLWFMAAYLSHNMSTMNHDALSGGLLALLGLVSPMVIAFIMMGSNPHLRHDLVKRFFNFNNIKPVYIILTCFLMLGSLLLAQAISLFFGHSLDQFSFAGTPSFTLGLIPAWFLLLLAPMVEELGWHTYGTDCLRARFNLFTTSLIFGAFWVLWHLPLAFIKDYYHSNVAETGWIYSLNFAISLFPFVILMNWLYVKTGRNILIPIVFHITAGLFNEMFLTHPDSKVIQTLLLLALSIYLICKDRALFFNRDMSEEM